MTIAARLSRAIALLLLSWQAVVVQAHLHVRPATAPVAVSGATAATTAPQRQDGPFECPICREVAHAGQYLSPAPVLFAPPAAIAPWHALIASPARGVEQRSHFWRSRAPPVPQLS